MKFFKNIEKNIANSLEKAKENNVKLNEKIKDKNLDNFKEKYDFLDLEPQEYASFKTILSNMGLDTLGSKVDKIAAKMSVSSVDRATIHLLSALSQQNVVLIGQLHKITEEIKKLNRVGDHHVGGTDEDF